MLTMCTLQMLVLLLLLLLLTFDQLTETDLRFIPQFQCHSRLQNSIKKKQFCIRPVTVSVTRRLPISAQRIQQLLLGK